VGFDIGFWGVESEGDAELVWGGGHFVWVLDFFARGLVYKINSRVVKGLKY
jgi:hypothetical protein